MAKKVITHVMYPVLMAGLVLLGLLGLAQAVTGNIDATDKSHYASRHLPCGFTSLALWVHDLAGDVKRKLLSPLLASSILV